MRAATLPVQRHPDAKLLVVNNCGNIGHRSRSEFASILRPGDVVVANDAAALPGSLSGHHGPTGSRIEVRLAGRDSLDEIRHFSAVVFGEGDFRTHTEDRPKPPTLNPGDLLELGPLRATVTRLLNHPRFISLQFEGSRREIWEGLAWHGRPIQYAHLSIPLALWDTWTPIAGPPVAFEPPSAGFVLDWSMLARLSARHIRFATITHAAGISSTGDAELDALLPFDEPYRIPPSTALMIRHAQLRRERIIAVGTTVVRALEHAASAFDGVVPVGELLATQRIGVSSKLRIVDAILSGVHERGTSHYELLRAFVDDQVLGHIDEELNAQDYRGHEFGDSVFIERSRNREAHAMSLGADKAYDTREFVKLLREMDIRPHLAQNLNRPGGSAIDGRTTGHRRYQVSQQKRPLIEKRPLGWMKQTGGMQKTKLRGLWKVGWQFLMTAAAFNLWRLPKLWPAIEGV